jgi:2'-5' RNA ligase
MKTNYPLIVTAHVVDADLAPFAALRAQHFPPDRNFLHAHVTMFHRLPGEHIDAITDVLRMVAASTRQIETTVNGVRHLGFGVAFTIDSAELQATRGQLKSNFSHWLNPQDTQPWRPHITVQNKVSKTAADTLFHELKHDFEPSRLRVVGFDLWAYLGGPWRLEASLDFLSLAAA